MILLLTREEKSLTELSKELACSKQTVLRYIEDLDLSSGHVEIETKKIGKEHFYKVKRPFNTPKMTLSETDYLVLEMCRSFTSHLLGKELFEEATQTIEKSRAYLKDPEKRGPGSYFSSIHTGTIDYTDHHDTIHSLIKAIKNRKIVTITYNAISDLKTKTYDIMPLKLFSHKDTIYLHARIPQPAGSKIKMEFDPLLAVHRIQKAELQPSSFEYPLDYDFEAIYNRHFGIIKDKAFKVIVEFTGWAANFVSERTWSPDQKIDKKDDNSIILTFTSSSEYEVIAWLLSFGDEAKLIGPDHLVKEMVDRIKGMSEVYHINK
jgi:predicted DNA-binding transcriptional regulator YafY